MINYTFLFLTLLYATFIPGYVIVEYLLSKISFYIKLPLYIIFSVLFSTYLSFLTAHYFGFNRTNIFFDIFISLVLLIPLLYKNRHVLLLTELVKNKKLILTAFIIFIIYFIPLNSGIFRLYGDSYIMSGPNWQDTAMHMSIIESISEGNFPPIAPYFSGEKLTYYYFSDLHASILGTMYGNFLPSVLTILNPIFAASMFLSVFALTKLLTKKDNISYITSLLSTFYGNLGFIDLIKDSLIKKQNYFTLLTNNAYHINQESSILMVPMADYFLQNRPMMVGLPTFVIVCILIFLYKNESKTKYLLLAGIVNSLLIKFQFFGFMIGVLFFVFKTIVNVLTEIKTFKIEIKKLLIFIVPSVATVVIFGIDTVGSRSLFKVVLDTLSFNGLFMEGLSWNIKFIINNFNLPIFIFLLSPVILFNKKIKEFGTIFLFTLFLITIPFVIRFTIYNYDMFKFFYYAIPFISIIFAFVSSYIYSKNIKYFYISCFILIISSVTSLNMIFHTILNKSAAYSIFEYEAGLWIRENTKKKSVFITYPSVHNGASDIAGRVRVLSYINWPYSHGFNEGADNVFSRRDDIDTYYNSPDRLDILDKYKVNYVFFGQEERSNFPESENRLESNSFLKKVYENKDVKVFERTR